jgi:SlyX protein
MLQALASLYTDLLARRASAVRRQCAMETAMNTEDRLVDIEIKLARQDDMVDTLNRLVYQQQKKIDELETVCSGLARRVKEMQDIATEDAAGDEKPPHY